MVTCPRCVLEGPLHAVEEVKHADARFLPVQRKCSLVPDRLRVYVKTPNLAPQRRSTTVVSKRECSRMSLLGVRGFSGGALHLAPTVQSWVNWLTEV